MLSKGYLEKLDVYLLVDQVLTDINTIAKKLNIMYTSIAYGTSTIMNVSLVVLITQICCMYK